MGSTPDESARLQRLEKVMEKMMEQINKEISVEDFKKTYPEYVDGARGRTMASMREQLLAQLSENVQTEFKTLCQESDLNYKFNTLDDAIAAQSLNGPASASIKAVKKSARSQPSPEEEVGNVLLKQKLKQLDQLVQQERILNEEYANLEKEKENLLIKGKTLGEQIDNCQALVLNN
mmetsp:Transcript_12132/g.15083  ORF Transcript_12132/g.15083 Transcript_12132/m.15083 type:complete len:177 (-) Transcript_12132:1100-1630(-)